MKLHSSPNTLVYVTNARQAFLQPELMEDFAGMYQYRNPNPNTKSVPSLPMSTENRWIFNITLLTNKQHIAAYSITAHSVFWNHKHVNNIKV